MNKHKSRPMHSHEKLTVRGTEKLQNKMGLHVSNRKQCIADKFRIFFLFLDTGKNEIFILIRYGKKGIKRIRRVICNWSPDCTSSFSKVHASG